MDVAPGEDADALDLLALTTDPDPDDLDSMRYSIVGGAPSGCQRDDRRPRPCRCAPTQNTPKGTAATLTVRVDDGATDPVEGSVVVTGDGIDAAAADGERRHRRRGAPGQDRDACPCSATTSTRSPRRR